MICDCCKRDVDNLRQSMWHGAHSICSECFYEWYDPMDKNVTEENLTSIKRIGNFVRLKFGLIKLAEQVSMQSVKPTS